MEYLHLDKWSEVPELTCLKPVRPALKSLYVKGEFDPKKFKHCVAVVGSRRMTQYGRQVIDRLVPQLVLEGKTIVSGFMYGVDQYAHQAAIDAGGNTVAVLGWGIENPMEETDIILAKKLLSAGGLLLSEWQNQTAALWTFPARNRIVAGLCQDVYIVEAAQKSGSLLTAELALKYNKQLWAVPGPVTSSTSAGTNNLIQSGKAKIWLGLSASPSKISCKDPILELISREPLTASDIARKLNQPIAQVGASLSLFSIANQVSEHNGKYYLNVD